MIGGMNEKAKKKKNKKINKGEAHARVRKKHNTKQKKQQRRSGPSHESCQGGVEQQHTRFAEQSREKSRLLLVTRSLITTTTELYNGTT